MGLSSSGRIWRLGSKLLNLRWEGLRVALCVHRTGYLI